MTPVLAHTRDELAAALDALAGSRALVMTMGALHEGHLQLVRRAQELADHVIVSIFVNPTQFAPGEDYDVYPRTLDADMAALAEVGCDLVWAPAPDDVYPEPVAVSIDPGPIAKVLEGVTRPTHFAGVALVCTKVVGLVRPDVAIYGEKDFQQLAVLRTVFRQLDIPVRVEGAPIVRDEDGVALSSRNRYLGDEERARARALSKGLAAGAEVGAAGGGGVDVVSAVVEVIEQTGGIDIDYVALADAGSFELLAGTADVEIPDAEGPVTLTAEGARSCRLLVAARVGTTRLIDNAAVSLTIEEGE